VIVIYGKQPNTIRLVLKDDISSAHSTPDTSHNKNTMVIEKTNKTQINLSFSTLLERNMWIAAINSQLKVLRKEKKEFEFIIAVLEPNEIVVKKGWIDTFSRRKRRWKKRYYVLTNRYMRYFGRFNTEQKGMFQVSKCHVIIELGTEGHFRMRLSEENEYYVRCGTDEEMYAWCTKLLESGAHKE
jgi:hypothetical protein